MRTKGAKAEPVGTTHVRRSHPDEREFDKFRVVRVSLGVVDGVPTWLCIDSSGGHEVSATDHPWNDEWELVT